MSKYVAPPSWWQLLNLVRQLKDVVAMWNGGKITHESAMRMVSELIREAKNV